MHSGLSKLLSLIVLAGLAAGCEPDYRDSVVRACVLDGNPRAYCDCTAQGMRAVLGLKNYLVFTDLVLLGGAEKAGPEDIVKLMEKHALTPTDFAEIRGRVGELGPQIHAQCLD